MLRMWNFWLQMYYFIVAFSGYIPVSCPVFHTQRWNIALQMVSWRGGTIQFVQSIRVTRCHTRREFQNSVSDLSKNSTHPFTSPVTLGLHLGKVAFEGRIWTLHLDVWAFIKLGAYMPSWAWLLTPFPLPTARCRRNCMHEVAYFHLAHIKSSVRIKYICNSSVEDYRIIESFRM